MTGVRTDGAHALRFGTPQEVVSLQQERALALFSPGAVFCLVRQSPSASGKLEWSLVVARAGGPGARLRPLPGVAPGADPLLAVNGRRRVRRVLGLIKALEKEGFSPPEISSAYWRRVGHRLIAEADFAPYSTAQHAAHLKIEALQR